MSQGGKNLIVHSILFLNTIRGDKMSTDTEMLEELREIRKLLTPAPKPPAPEGLMNEFVAFISNYKVLGLAVAFILGIYIGQVVQALVNSGIMPLIEFVYPPIQPEGVDYVLSAGPIIDSLITFKLSSSLLASSKALLSLPTGSPLSFKGQATPELIAS